MKRKDPLKGLDTSAACAERRRQLIADKAKLEESLATAKNAAGRATAEGAGADDALMEIQSLANRISVNSEALKLLDRHMLAVHQAEKIEALKKSHAGRVSDLRKLFKLLEAEFSEWSEEKQKHDLANAEFPGSAVGDPPESGNVAFINALLRPPKEPRERVPMAPAEELNRRGGKGITWGDGIAKRPWSG